MNLNLPDKIGGIPSIPLIMICIVLIAGGVAFATFTNHPNPQTGLSGQQEGMSDEEIQKTLENENITQQVVTSDGDTTESEDGVTELSGAYLKKLYGYTPTTVTADPVYDVQLTTTNNPAIPPAQPQINHDTTSKPEPQPGTVVIPNNTTSTGNNLTENDEGYYNEGEWDPFEDPIEPENPDNEYEDENDST
ncbi:hypothetical protein [uncultured Methanobacterium sp.]|uniref:hypothetical protein n=1 Tax=uncultured Methanobacterium sp. TaxID=176306 RepID=UPI002AA5ECC9|nr:hypothetical protein [uncultured Methanobacterium sp.]